MCIVVFGLGLNVIGGMVLRSLEFGGFEPHDILSLLPHYITHHPFPHHPFTHHHTSPLAHISPFHLQQ